MFSYKKITALFLVLLNAFCLAQTWVTWDNTSGASTAAASAANNPVTGAVSVSAVYGGTKNDIFYSPVSSTYSSRLVNNFDGAAISNQVLLQEFSAYQNKNTTSVTFTFEKPVKILEFVVTDPDFGDRNRGSEWDDSFSIGMDNGATFGSVSSGISNGGNTGVGLLTSGGAVVTTSGFDHGTYKTSGSEGTEWIIWKDSSAKVKSITINFKMPKSLPETLPAVLYYAIKVEGLAQTNCTAVPSPQFAANTTATATMNGVTVTRTLSRALYSPGETGMASTTYCNSNYAKDYAWVRSNPSRHYVTYTFSTPQNSAQFFLMEMGNNFAGSTADRDEALFTLRDEKGDAISSFNLTKNPGGSDCHNIITIDNSTHIVSSTSTTKVTSDAAILVNSTTPFTSVTIEDNRVITFVNNRGGYGFYVEICPTSLSGACYRPATTGTGALPVYHGITSLQRAAKNSTDTSNWPLVRRGAWTALEANSKGFVPNRLSDSDVAQIPAANLRAGMMVYNTTQDCLQINTDGTATGWKCFNTAGCAPN